MSCLRILACAVLVPLFSFSSFGQATIKVAEPTITPPPAKRGADVMEKVVPDINFNDVTLEQAIDFLQEAVPDLKAVIVRDTGVQADCPRVKLKLKGLSLAQLWGVLKLSYPELMLKQVDAPGPGVVWHIRVISNNAPVEAAATSVRIYRLTPIVEGLAVKAGKNDADAEKHALNHVLSLIKAALEQAAIKTETPPTLQVHEETLTLIFKGNENQTGIVESVMQSFSPTNDAETAKIAEMRQRVEATERDREKLMDVTRMEKDRAAELLARLTKELDQSREVLKEQQNLATERALEAEKLKLRLEDAEKLMKVREAMEAEMRKAAENKAKSPKE